MNIIQLERTNIIYRRPDIVERIRASYAAAQARRWAELITTHHPHADSVLDVGCWTGQEAEYLGKKWAVTGIDIQPHLIRYAREHRSGAEFVCGDITTVRLDKEYSVILCAGNTLSYIHESADLDAAFATFSVHAQENALLILQTLLANPADQAVTRVDELRADYADEAQWCPLRQLATTRRTWRYDDGTREIDVLHRRVLPVPEIELRARFAGWSIVSSRLDSAATGGDATGCVVARFDGSAGRHSSPAAP